MITKRKSGRKPLADKKRQVTLYIRESIINAKGTIDNFQQFLTNKIEKNENNILETENNDPDL